MSKFFIPKIGQKLEVLNTWTITIHPGVKNISMGIATENYVGNEDYGYWKDGDKNIGFHPYKITAHNRTYIKTYSVGIEPGVKIAFNGVEYRTSYWGPTRVSFKITSGKFKGVSFWVTIDDANNLEYSI